MIAIALKNTILICLIVAIGYFMIENHLNAMKHEKMSTRKTSTMRKVKKDVIKNIIESSEDTKTRDEEETKEENEESTKMRLRIDENMREIYNYVYGDDAASANLEDIYEKTKAREVEKDMRTFCESSEDEKVKKMCEDPIKVHHKEVDYEHIENKPIFSGSLYEFVDKNM